MRTIEYSSAFKKDYRKCKSTPRHTKDLDDLLRAVLGHLLNDTPLAIANRDHDLVGNWHGYRECHIKPDLLLIYKKPDQSTLRLARLGSHSELFG